MKLLTDFLFDREGSERRDLSILLMLFALPFLLFLGRVPLIEPDEGRYAEIPREMLELGDFITPHLNYVKYFEKPPLHYWLNAVSFKIFGLNEFAARLPGALMGLVAVLVVYHTGRRLFGRSQGILSAAILGTSIGFLLESRFNIIDMTLTSTLSAALLFFLVAAKEGEPRKGLYYHLFYLCSALAVLAKGLIGIVFPGAIIFLFMLLSGRWRLLREMRLLSGVPLFLLVSAPWFVAVSLKNPEFPHFFFIREHFQRFTTTVHHHKKGWWFFIPVLLGTMLPWSLFIPGSLRGLWRERQSNSGGARLFLLIWAAFIFLFFSASSSQLEPYILPTVPPLALLMGSAFAALAARMDIMMKAQARLTAAVLIIGGIWVVCHPFIARRPGLTIAGGALIGLILVVEGAMAMRNSWRTPREIIVGLLLCSYLIALVTPNLFFGGMAKRRSLKGLGQAIVASGDKQAMIASFSLLQGLPFYTGRRVVVVGDPGETEFGSSQGDNSGWFIDLRQFAADWDSPRRVFAVMSREEMASLGKMVQLKPRVLAEGGKKILVSNR